MYSSSALRCAAIRSAFNRFSFVFKPYSDAFRHGPCGITPSKEVVNMTEAQKQAYEELYYMTVELLDELDELKRKIVAQQQASEALRDLPED